MYYFFSFVIGKKTRRRRFVYTPQRVSSEFIRCTHRSRVYTHVERVQNKNTKYHINIIVVCQ